MERFIDPQAGCRQESKQRGVGAAAKFLGGWQRSRILDQADYVLIGIKPRWFPTVPLADQVTGRYLGAGIGRAPPHSESPHDIQSPRPGAGLSRGGLQGPLARQLGGDERTARLVHERHEGAKEARRQPEPKPQVPTHGDVLVQSLGEIVHCAPPPTGHGWASARSPPMSTLA